MEIIVAENAGFCYGVKRAINLASHSVYRANRTFTLGPIIHNPQVVKKLTEAGIKTIDDLDQIDRGTIIFRSHGVSPKIYQKAKEKGLEIIDATCPNVSKVQKIALHLKKKGYTIIIIGEKEHPEVTSILELVANNVFCLNSSKEVSKLFLNTDKLGVVAQTTQTLENFKKIVYRLISHFKELRVFNTICKSALSMQKSSLQLAKKVGVMIVIGGYNSANTRRLTDICKKVNHQTYHIEESRQLKSDWIKDQRIIGVTAGASTPSWIIEDVVKKLKSIDNENR
ncbi:MAG: 4-hydroxy-3-methylbut-2-enyl diphosphate reductase [bacterium]